MKKINKYYTYSQIIITIISFIFWTILFRNEDSSWFIANFLLTSSTLIISFLSTPISKKICKIGCRIKNKILKIIYYVSNPLIMFFICTIIEKIRYYNFSKNPTPTNLSEGLGNALFYLFISVLFFIVLFLPIMQLLIVFIISKLTEILKKED